MKQVNYLILTLLIVLLAACGKQKVDNKSADDLSNTKQDNNLQFITKTEFKSYQNCKPGEPNCTYIRLSYVVITTGKIKDKINSMINSQLLFAYEMPDAHFKSTDEMMSMFLRDYESFRTQMPSAPQIWSVEMKFVVKSQTEKTLCVLGDLYSYLGGAHPNSMQGFLNFNKETGDTISLSSLFANGFEPKLNTLIDKKYREMKGLKPGDNLADKGDLFENKIELTHNFAINQEKGIEFVYNPYEIAPYAVGPITIKLSNAEIKDILASNSLLK